MPCGRRCAGQRAGGEGEAGEDAGQCDRQAGAQRMSPWPSVLVYRSFLSGARGDSAGTHRAGASEGGRRGAMGAVCGRGRCRTVEHSLSRYLGLPGRPLEVPCQPFPTVWNQPAFRYNLRKTNIGPMFIVICCTLLWPPIVSLSFVVRCLIASRCTGRLKA